MSALTWGQRQALVQLLTGRVQADTVELGVGFRNASAVLTIVVTLDGVPQEQRPFIRYTQATNRWTIGFVLQDGTEVDQLADPWLYAGDVRLVQASTTTWDIIGVDDQPLALEQETMHLWLGLPQVPGLDFTLTGGGTRIVFTKAPTTPGIGGAPSPYLHMAKRLNHP